MSEQREQGSGSLRGEQTQSGAVDPEARLERFSRQMLLDPIGGRGQARLAEAKVLIVGAGGLGSPVAMYLAAAGVGALTLLDPDQVSLSNLHRQILYDEESLGQKKVERALLRLAAMDGALQLEGISDRLNQENADDLFRAHSLVVDGSDNFETRFVANDAALRTGTPLVHGAVLGFSGQLTVVDGLHGGCYRCLFEAPPPPDAIPSCAVAGVLGSVCGVVGSLMATEALKQLLGLETLAGSMLVYDGLEARTRRILLPQRADCAACAERPSRSGGPSI